MTVSSRRMLLCLLVFLIFALSSLPLTSRADVSAPSETGDTIHAEPFLSSVQGTSAAGNSVFLQVYALGFNPIDSGDSANNYFLFDVQAAATPSIGWSIDTSGMNDANGPTLLVAANLPACSSEAIVGTDVDPSTSAEYYSSGTPITISVTVPVGPASASISDTFYSESSQTQATKIEECSVQWNSGYCVLIGDFCSPVSGGDENAYSYHFVMAVQVPKGQQLEFQLSAEGSFYKCNLLCVGASYDKASASLNQSYLIPPVITVASDPAGSGYVDVNGTPIITPEQYVWDIGSTHQISAAEFVSGGSGLRYQFQSWSDGGSISHEITVPTNATTYEAYYQEQDRLIISPSSGGTTDPPSSTNWYQFNESTPVQALPAPGYQLDNWILDGVNIGNSSGVLVSMNSPHNLTAVFKLEPILSVTSEAGGTVTIESPAINSGTPVIIGEGQNQNFSVPTGAEVTLSADPIGPSTFKAWDGTFSQASNPLTLDVNANLQEEATFSNSAANATPPEVQGQTTTNNPSTSSGGTLSGATQFAGINIDSIIIAAAIILAAVIVAVALRPRRQITSNPQTS